jgi:hypothetical protein
MMILNQLSKGAKLPERSLLQRVLEAAKRLAFCAAEA